MTKWQHKVTISVDDVIKKGCVSTQRAAEILGCSRSAVYDLMKDNYLPYLKVRSGRNIPLVGLEKFIQINLIQD